MHYPQMAKEFPDFDQSTLPVIPEGFADESWHNEQCPDFVHAATGLQLFVDYPNPADREFPESDTRYALRQMVSDSVHGWQSGSDDLITSDDWAEVEAAIRVAIAKAVGDAFAAKLKADLTPEAFAAMRATNVGNVGDSVCASHDHCDANMPMAEAFAEVVGREFNGEIAADLTLWNAAWQRAKIDHLTERAEGLTLDPQEVEIVRSVFNTFVADAEEARTAAEVIGVPLAAVEDLIQKLDAWPTAADQLTLL